MGVFVHYNSFILAASPVVAQSSTNAPTVALIVVSILLVLAMAGIIVLGIITCKLVLSDFQ